MTVDPLELRALMIRGLDGDAVAYKSLLGGLGRLLRGYFAGKLVRSGRASGDTEDLVQDALMAIHVHRQTYRRAEPLMPWVYAIARHKLVDHMRRTRYSMSDTPITGQEEAAAQDDQSGAESSLDVDRLLGELPEKMRQSIRLVKIDGLSVVEAARRTGFSESAVKVNIHRGLKALAASIARRTAT